MIRSWSLERCSLCATWCASWGVKRTSEKPDAVWAPVLTRVTRQLRVLYHQPIQAALLRDTDEYQVRNVDGSQESQHAHCTAANLHQFVCGIRLVESRELCSVTLTDRSSCQKPPLADRTPRRCRREQRALRRVPGAVRGTCGLVLASCLVVDLFSDLVADTCSIMIPHKGGPRIRWGNTTGLTAGPTPTPGR